MSEEINIILDMLKDISKDTLVLKNKTQILSICLEYKIRLTSSQIDTIANNRKYSEDKETLIKSCLLFGRDD